MSIAPLKMNNAHTVLTSLATAGAIETGYLTATKLSKTAAFCTGAGSESLESACNSILSGPYSEVPVVNIPLVFVAFILYTSIAAMSIRAANTDSETAAGYNSKILFLTTTMATFSAYLMFVLTSVLQASCSYCYLSAGISFSMAAIAWTNRIVPNATRAFVLTFSSVAISSVTSAVLFYATSVLSLGLAGLPSPAQASTAPAAQAIAAGLVDGVKPVKQNKAPAVTQVTSTQALAVANRLEKLDAKMYGAFWCSHCYNQKQALGAQAVGKFEYIECDKEGVESQYPTCKAKKIPGYPTWEIRGKYYPGEKDLNELTTLLDSIEKQEVN